MTVLDSLASWVSHVPELSFDISIAVSTASLVPDGILHLSLLVTVGLVMVSPVESGTSQMQLRQGFVA